MVHRIEIGRGADNVTWQVYLDAQTFVEVDRTGIMSYLSGQERRDNALVSAVASDVLQMLWDGQEGARQLLADLPDDDPGKAIDPALPELFHARTVPADQIGQGQNKVDVYRPIWLVGGVATHIISRTSLLTVVYTGDIQTATIRTEFPTILR